MAVARRTLVLPLSPSPGTSSSLSKTLDLLHPIVGSKGALELPPGVFLVILGAQSEDAEFDAQLSHKVCELLRRIARPIIGVAKGRISSGGARLLSCCDRVLACDDAQFYQGSREALGPETVPAGNLGCEMACLAHTLERSSLATLASMKSNFLVAKVLQRMKPKVEDDSSQRSAKDELARREASVPAAKGKAKALRYRRGRSGDSIKEEDDLEGLSEATTSSPSGDMEADDFIEMDDDPMTESQ